MNTTLAYLRGRRAWLVENIAVWGTDRDAVIRMAAIETVGSDVRLGWWAISLGGQFQDISFSDLVDSRGNTLPGTIDKPAVVVIPRAGTGAFVKIMNGDSGFSIACNDADATPVLVDLLIFEMGR
ncbi:MAG: hypothetical protein R3F48_15120 [Candidatus Zixiibacteriota bacterium]